MKNNAILFLIAITVACSSPAEHTAPKAAPILEIKLTPEQMQTINISLVEAKQEPLAATVHLNGKVTVAPNQKVSMTSPWGGYIKALPILEILFDADKP